MRNSGKIPTAVIRRWLLAFAACAALPHAALAQQKIARGWPALPGVAVRIHNLNGSVRVIGWERDSVSVIGYSERDAGRFFGGGAPQALKMGIWNELPGDTGRAVFEVRVPVSAQVWIKTAGASIEVAGVHGTLDLNTVTGSIRVSGSARDVAAESITGNIELEAASRSVRARSGSGSVAVVGHAADATLRTVSGELSALGVRFERARLETIGGDIRFDGVLPPGSALELQSHSGRIDVALPASTAAQFTVSTLKGKVANSFGPEAGKSGELVFGTGSGSATLVARTFSGSISLRKRVEPKTR